MNMNTTDCQAPGEALPGALPAIAECLSDVRGSDLVFGGKVRDGARDFHDVVIRARRERE